MRKGHAFNEAAGFNQSFSERRQSFKYDSLGIDGFNRRAECAVALQHFYAVRADANDRVVGERRPSLRENTKLL